MMKAPKLHHPAGHHGRFHGPNPGGGVNPKYTKRQGFSIEKKPQNPGIFFNSQTHICRKKKHQAPEIEQKIRLCKK